MKEDQEKFRSKFHHSLKHENHQRWQSWKSSQDDLVLYPKHVHILFGSFLIFSHLYDLKKTKSKFHNFWHENLPKLETNPRWLVFALKPFSNHFLSFCYCFPSIWIKNVLVKISWLLAQKLAKLAKTWHELVLPPKCLNILFCVDLWLFDKNEQENFRSKFHDSFRHENCQN